MKLNYLRTAFIIHFDAGEEVTIFDADTKEVTTTVLEDELNFDIASFNRKVITESFNRVICDQLVQSIDPMGKEKTMIFCVSIAHANKVKELLDEAYKELYGNAYNQSAVQVLTGATDKVNTVISEYKNDKFPTIAITVDLLTTGIDVPAICHLVFMRRVKSRILFEQMLGRATRRCDEIGKSVFHVYDPVDIFSKLEKVNTMKPLVKNPNVTMAQMVDELCGIEHESAELARDGVSSTASEHARQVADELNQKLMRVLRKASKKSESNEKLKQKLTQLEETWGVEPAKLHTKLHEGGVGATLDFLQKNPNLLNDLAEVKFIVGSDSMPVIYEGEDELVSMERRYGEENIKPEV